MDTVRIDYLTVKLSPSFTFGDWWNYSQSPILDERTGEVCGVRIPQKEWRIARSGKNQTISCWGMYADRLTTLAITEELDITRLDICLDCEVKSENEVLHDIQRLSGELLSLYKSRGREISHISVQGTARDGGKTETVTFGGRKSPYQIRIYGKRIADTGEQFLRYEFQLRGKLAKTSFNLIRARYGSNRRTREVFRSLEARILKSGAFGIDWGNTAIHEIDRSEDNPPSQRERWIRTQVLAACIKEFHETGRNLPQILLEDFNNHFVAIAAINIDYSNQYAALELKSSSLAQTNETAD